jgi:hypothetical protein
MGGLPMNGTKAALVVVIGIGLAACQRTPEKSAVDANAQALEKRIAALEQQTPPPSTAAPADPAGLNLAPEPTGPRPTYVVERTPPARTPATTSRRTARAPRATASTTRPATRETNEPVERIGGPAVEPIEPMEPMAGTGDPGPRRETLVIPGGTELRIVLETGLSSETSQDGERVVARVERAMAQDGRVVLPGGTVLRGRVMRAESAGRVRGRSHLTVDFDRIVVRGREHPLQSTSITVDGPDDTKRDVAVIAGSTAAGAVIGKIMDKGAKKGAAVGAATGAGAVLVTRGQGIEMPAGSRWTVRVTNTVRLD